jgi:hypothetical protein
MKAIRVLSDFLDKKFYKTKLESSQVVERYNATNYGFQSRPIKGSNAVVVDEYIIGFVQKIIYGLEVGESIMFCKKKNIETEEVEIVTKVICKADGNLILNGEGDFAVRFNELEKSYNELRDFINNHTHDILITSGVVAGQYPVVGVVPKITTGSNASIADAKVKNIILPQKEN